MSDADGLLKARNLAPLRRLEGAADAAVYLCRKTRGTTPFRIAVLRAGAVTAEIPDLATAQLVVAASGRLLAGRWVLFAHAPGGMTRHVAAFDLDSSTVNPRFFDLGGRGVQIVGFDVDPAGLLAAVGFALEDEDGWLHIFDSRQAAWLEIDAAALMGACLRTNAQALRWAGDSDALEVFSEVDRTWHRCPLDLARRKLLWA